MIGSRTGGAASQVPGPVARSVGLTAGAMAIELTGWYGLVLGLRRRRRSGGDEV